MKYTYPSTVLMYNLVALVLEYFYCMLFYTLILHYILETNIVLCRFKFIINTKYSKLIHDYVLYPATPTATLNIYEHINVSLVITQ